MQLNLISVYQFLKSPILQSPLIPYGNFPTIASYRFSVTIICYTSSFVHVTWGISLIRDIGLIGIGQLYFFLISQVLCNNWLYQILKLLFILDFIFWNNVSSHNFNFIVGNYLGSLGKTIFLELLGKSHYLGSPDKLGFLGDFRW